MSICLFSVSVAQQSVELILSFHHVGAGNWVPITRLGSKYLYLLCYLTSLMKDQF